MRLARVIIVLYPQVLLRGALALLPRHQLVHRLFALAELVIVAEQITVRILLHHKQEHATNGQERVLILLGITTLMEPLHVVPLTEVALAEVAPVVLGVEHGTMLQKVMGTTQYSPLTAFSGQQNTQQLLVDGMRMSTITLNIVTTARSSVLPVHIMDGLDIFFMYAVLLRLQELYMLAVMLPKIKE